MVETVQKNIAIPTISTDKAPMPHKTLALRLFFRFLQFIATVTLRLYFRRIEIINPELLNSSGRIILISNHPNTLIDPLMALQQSFVRPFLLANASLFKNIVPRTILSALYCLPIKRAKDFDSGFVNNNQIFARCITHLQEGGSLYIAPEGTSINERHIRPFKKGLAHIYEQAHREGMTDVKILMVGLTYYNPQKANSDVVIEVGELFQPDIDFKNLSHGKRLDAILEQIESRFHELVIHCEDAEEENLLAKFETLAQSNEPLPLKEKYMRSKEILSQMRREKIENEEVFVQKKEKVESYFEFLEKNKLRDVNINTFGKTQLKRALLAFCLLPLTFWGFINNIIPLTVIGILKRSRYFNFESDYYTCVQYVSGMVLYPLFWWLQLNFWRWFFYHSHDAYIYFVSVVACGLIARAQWVWFKKQLNYLATQVCANQVRNLRPKSEK